MPAIVFLLTSLLFTITAPVTSQATETHYVKHDPLTSRELAAAMVDLTDPDPKTRKEASKLLSYRACSDIGPPIVEQLEANPAFHNPQVRRTMFETVSTCTGVKGAEVERILLSGIGQDNAHIVVACARALSSAGGDVKRKAAHVFTLRWNYWIQPGDDPAAWIAEVVSRLDAADEIVDMMQESQGPARKTTLWVLGMAATETAGDFDGVADHKQAIREFVINSLESPDADVRRAAAEALSPAFGADTVIFESPTEYELNPLLEETLEHLARNSPDALLQDRASKTLAYLREHLDDVAQKILRERQKEKKTGETVPLP